MTPTLHQKLTQAEQALAAAEATVRELREELARKKKKHIREIWIDDYLVFRCPDEVIQAADKAYQMVKFNAAFSGVKLNGINTIAMRAALKAAITAIGEQEILKAMKAWQGVY